MGKNALLLGLGLVIIVGLYVGFSMNTVPEGHSGVTDSPIDNITGVDISKENPSNPERNLPVMDGINDTGLPVMDGINDTRITEPENTSVKKSTDDDSEDNAVVLDDQGEKSIDAFAFNGSNEVLFFWVKGCPHCAAEEDFLDELEHKYPEVDIVRYEVDDENIDIIKKVCTMYNLTCDSVPITLIAGVPFVKYNDYDGKLLMYPSEGGYLGYRNQIENTIRELLGLENTDPLAFIAPLGTEVGQLRNHMSFSAKIDKDTYYERDPIWVSVTIFSDWNIPHCRFFIHGIGGEVDDDIDANIGAGENRFVFREKAPLCFGCSDFKPGGYDITISLQRDGMTVFEETKEVEILDRE